MKVGDMFRTNGSNGLPVMTGIVIKELPISAEIRWGVIFFSGLDKRYLNFLMLVAEDDGGVISENW